MPPRETTDSPTINALDDRLRGTVIQPGEDGYGEARTLWNDAIEKYPAAIAQCEGTADVIQTVRFAHQNKLPLTVKGGGHGIAGTALNDDGVVIDLAPLNAVRVHPDRGTVHVQGGATWGAINHETTVVDTLANGIPYPDVGVGGYTLGGGIGVLTRAKGLAVDTLRSVDVVTASGDLVHATEDQHPDLFWAVRGGGPNFGVVTAFEFECYDYDPTILTGRFIYPVDATGDVLRFYREYMTEAPPELFSSAVTVRLPTLPEFPEQLHDETVTAITLYYIGDPTRGRQAIEPVQDVDQPLLDVVETTPYQDLGFDLLDAGRRNHWNSHFLETLSDAAIDTFLEYASDLPTSGTALGFDSLGGAMTQIDDDATAFPHRDANYLFATIIQWTDPNRDEEYRDWARDVHEAMTPHTTGGEYLNNQTDTDADRLRAAFGDNYERLREIKTEWDPTNLFGGDQGIEPSA